VACLRLWQPCRIFAMVAFTYDEYVAADVVSALGDEDLSAAKSLAEAALAKKRATGPLLGMVLVLLETNDISSAKPLLEEALELAIKAKDKPGEAAASKFMGVVAAKQKKKDEAEQCFGKAKAIYTEKKNKAGEAAVLATMSKLSIPAPDYDLSVANEALALFKSIKDTKGMAFVYSTIIEMKLKDGKASQAANVSDELVALFKGDKEMEATALLSVSGVLLASGSAQDALTKAKEAAELYGKAGLTSKKASAINTIANVLCSAQMFDDALKATKAAVTLCKEKKDKKGHAATLCMEASIYDMQRKYSKAVHKLEKAASIYRMLKDKSEEAKTLETAASMCLKTTGMLDDISEPATLAQKAISLYSELGMSESVETAYCLQTLAFALMLCDKPNEAIDKAKDSMAIFQEKENMSGEAGAYAVLAQLYWEMNDKEEAERMATRASNLAADAGDAGEKAWADSLVFKYSGKEAEKAQKKIRGLNALQSSGGDTANVQTSWIGTYYWGKEYSTIDGFQMRGVSEAPAKGAKGASSSSIMALESKTDALQLDLDFASLGSL